MFYCLAGARNSRLSAAGAAVIARGYKELTQGVSVSSAGSHARRITLKAAMSPEIEGNQPPAIRAKARMARLPAA